LLIPVFIVFQYILGREKKHKLDIRYFFICLPAILVLGLHLYIYYKIGESNLGMIGYVFAKYGGGSSLPGFISMAKNQLKMLYAHFFNVYFIIVTALSFLYFFNKKGKSNLKLTGLFFWVLFIFFINAYFKQSHSLDTFRYSHYFVPLILISGYMVTYIFEYLRELKIGGTLKRYLKVLLALFFITLFFYNTAIVTRDVLNRKVYSNPLKAVSFYTREHGDEETTIFQLVAPGSPYNAWGEYYFGKCYIEPGDETGVKRQLFCFGEHAIDDYKRAYNLKDFDFYVEYHDGSYSNKKKDFLNSIEARGLKKVASINRSGKTLATIYSPHSLSFEVIDADTADKQWDKKYANLKSLLQSRWCGLAILWGYHHRLK
jgi:hypothetical protein